MKRFLFLIFLFSQLAFAQVHKHSSGEKATLTIADTGHTMISRDIYGMFSEHLGRGIYDGIYYKGHIRPDIVAALKAIDLPNLRWPGGCFADQYHWRDGIGLHRPKTVNTTWGMVTEDNDFGTEEFLKICREIGCEPYIAGNVGTGSPQEMKDWLTYLNYTHHNKVSYWGVGNESWGCGGNMVPEYYANLYKHFAAFLPDYPGTQLKKIISGPDRDDYRWMETMMKDIGPDNNAWGVSLHYYIFTHGSATDFDEKNYQQTLIEEHSLDTILEHHERIMDQYDPKKHLALCVDEWGVWAHPEPGTPHYAMYQQGSLRDALIAASTLNLFNNHADRVRLANLAQTVNVIHAVILTKGNKMLLTPTYWVFDLYKAHQGARLLPLHIETPLYDSVPAINASASVKNEITHITLVNLDAHKSITVQTKMQGTVVSGRILTSARFHDFNSFDQPNRVKPNPFHDASITDNQLSVVLPPLSNVALDIK